MSEVIRAMIAALSEGRVLRLCLLLYAGALLVLVFERYTLHYRLGKISAAARILNELRHPVPDSTGDVADVRGALARELGTLLADANADNEGDKRNWNVVAAVAPWALYGLSFFAVGRNERRRILVPGLALTLGCGVVAGLGASRISLTLPWAFRHLVYPVAFCIVAALAALVVVTLLPDGGRQSSSPPSHP